MPDVWGDYPHRCPFDGSNDDTIYGWRQVEEVA
jgi:hypothetical protein